MCKPGAVPSEVKSMGITWSTDKRVIRWKLCIDEHTTFLTLTLCPESLKIGLNSYMFSYVNIEDHHFQRR